MRKALKKSEMIPVTCSSCSRFVAYIYPDTDLWCSCGKLVHRGAGGGDSKQAAKKPEGQ